MSTSLESQAKLVSLGCPTPWKVARRKSTGFQRYVGEGSTVEVYRCRCGLWHLASTKARKEALRG